MNISTNPHWAALKARGVRDLGYAGFADFLRFASRSVRNLGDDGAAAHFAFAAKQIEMEGKRHEAA